MLVLKVPQQEFFNEKTNEFSTYPGYTIKIEHSLYAISKWESYWKKPFLSEEPHSKEEALYYVFCMVIEPEITLMDVKRLPRTIHETISEYIQTPATATTIQHYKELSSTEIITAEIIYYWMVGHRIPFECQYWHFDKLMKLIQTCSIKSGDAKKMSKADAAAYQRAAMAKRRANRRR